MDMFSDFAWILQKARANHVPDALEAGRLRRAFVIDLAGAAVRLAELSIYSESPDAQLAFASEAARFAEIASLASKI